MSQTITFPKAWLSAILSTFAVAKKSRVSAGRSGFRPSFEQLETRLVPSATHFLVNTPLIATPGTPATFTVTAEDANNDPVDDYLGTVRFSSSDGAAILPNADVPLTPSQGQFTATFNTLGNQTITVTDFHDPSISGTSNATTVMNLPIVTGISPNSGTAAGGTTVTITGSGFTVPDGHFIGVQFGNAPAASFTVLSDTQISAVAPPGTGYQDVTVTTIPPGTSAVTAADVFTYVTAPATHFLVEAQSTATAGAPFSFFITAKDNSNATALNYNGTVTVTSTDAGAILPTSVTLVHGTSGMVTGTFQDAGNQTISVTDSQISGTSDPVAVSPAIVTHFSITAPAHATASLNFPITVTALDSANRPVVAYTGTIQFTSSDSKATLPVNYTFTRDDKGAHTFNVSMLTAAPETISVNNVGSGDITGTTSVIVNPALNVVGAAPGQAPLVQVFNVDGSLRFSLMAFDPAFTGGVTTAVGDVNGDGVSDIIAAAGPGGGPNITAFSGTDGSRLFSFFAFDPRFVGGTNVAIGDVNGDGVGDLVVGAGPGGGPNVIAVSGKDLQTILDNWMAFNPAFTGGVNVAAADVTGDGLADVVVGAGQSGGPNVVVLNGENGQQLASYLAYDPTLTGGVSVAAADVRGTGVAQVITGPGSGVVPRVQVLDPLSGNQLANFLAYAVNAADGVRVGVGKAGGSNSTVVLTGKGFKATSFDTGFDGLEAQGQGGLTTDPNNPSSAPTPHAIDQFFAFAA